MIKFSQLLVIIFVTAFAAMAAQAGAETGAAYGTKVKFAKGHKIAFPDASLEYVGQHRTSSEKYPRGFLFYDFKATIDGRPVAFSWSSGTGDIGPARFGAGAHRFSLELKRSDKLGPLKDDELVVWKN